MKKTLQALLIGVAISQSVTTAIAQTVVTGPSSSQSPYILPVTPGYTVTSILTVPDAVGNYTMSGIPDGAGAYDNNDGTFTFLLNHEIGAGLGAVRAHGSNGAFVSKWVINKTTLAVVSGADLIQNVNLWNPSTSTYSVYNATTPSTLASFGRFCSGDLEGVSAYYNSYTGKGTQERIYMNGEETGAEGRLMAHIVTGPGAGNSFELPFFGKYSCENLVANPRRSDKTIVAGFDDSTPGQVYIYVGNKSASGNDITKAGLTGGQLYGVAVSGMLTETSASFASPNTTFSLVNLGSGIQSITGASLNTLSNNLGVTNFLRPEDGAWDPSNPRDLYFNTTNAFNSPTRVWRLRFNDINSPELGGTITAVLDGTEGGQMFDNMGIDNSGHIILQEDVGNNAHLGKMWEYTIATDALVQITTHDSNRFLTGAPGFLTQDEEGSGVFDAQEILGPGMFLFVDQAHYAIPGAAVEGGQILALKSANTASSNPEINVLGNAINIPAGNNGISVGNNTDFGLVNVGSPVNEVFTIQNTGTGALLISSIDFSGPNAGDFVVLNPPAYPITIAPNGSLALTVRLIPALSGTRSARINLNNNDSNESLYDFAIQGIGATPEINIQGNNQNIPAGNNTSSTANNTDFGSVQTGASVNKTFFLQNTGNGTLTVSGINFSGANASEFSLVSAPAFPWVIVGSGSQSITVRFLPTVSGNRSAKININNDDSDEAAYDFLLTGTSATDVSIKTNTKDASLVSLFPNPTKDEAVLSILSEKSQNATISIIDITGKMVSTTIEKDLASGENQINLNTSELKNGIYFVRVVTAEKTSEIKMIVKH
jgi:hypothetical protein